MYRCEYVMLTWPSTNSLVAELLWYPPQCGAWFCGTRMSCCYVWRQTGCWRTWRRSLPHQSNYRKRQVYVQLFSYSNSCSNSCSNLCFWWAMDTGFQCRMGSHIFIYLAEACVADFLSLLANQYASPILGPLLPLFWISNDISSGFQDHIQLPCALWEHTWYMFSKIQLCCCTCWPHWHPAGNQPRSSHGIASRGDFARSQRMTWVWASAHRNQLNYLDWLSVIHFLRSPFILYMPTCWLPILRPVAFWLQITHTQRECLYYCALYYWGCMGEGFAYGSERYSVALVVILWQYIFRSFWLIRRQYSLSSVRDIQELDNSPCPL